MKVTLNTMSTYCGMSFKGVKKPESAMKKGLGMSIEPRGGRAKGEEEEEEEEVVELKRRESLLRRRGWSSKRGGSHC